MYMHMYMLFTVLGCFYLSHYIAPGRQGGRFYSYTDLKEHKEPSTQHLSAHLRLGRLRAKGAATPLYLGQSKSAIAGPPSVRHGRACGTATTWYQGLPAVLVGQVREAPKGSSPRATREMKRVEERRRLAKVGEGEIA